ncbi:MAG: SIS domain-containing protein [Actinomycetales bacterium]|nr:SIS domain-containing protein [Actinomycetales bacterium]
MDPSLFEADLHAKPATLRELADYLEQEDPWAGIGEVRRLIFLGMGSSAFAAGACVTRLLAAGFPGVSVLGSSMMLPATLPGDLVVAVSASGTSKETLAAVDGIRQASDARGGVPVILLTNTEGVERPGYDGVVQMRAGLESGGVACRSFQHTMIMLLALQRHLIGLPRDLPALVRLVADASEDLLQSAPAWLPTALELLIGPQGTHVVAPAHRLSSAQQGALMLREGPRRQGYACETGDWSHIDVYLTKTTDYRMLLYAGSAWDAQAMDWVRERGSTVVSVGGAVAGARASIRYAGDEDDDIRWLTETLVAELIAARLWHEAAAAGQ